jgi:hypothetical protein
MCVCVCEQKNVSICAGVAAVPHGLILFLNQLFLAPVTLVDTRSAAESPSVQAQKMQMLLIGCWIRVRAALRWKQCGTTSV